MPHPSLNLQVTPLGSGGANLAKAREEEEKQRTSKDYQARNLYNAWLTEEDQRSQSQWQPLKPSVDAEVRKLGPKP